jgi:NDP-4-keto-2,6-dideoxyhexose 3-C-methyltransferase
MKIQLQTKTKNNVSTRTSCRICGEGNLKPVLSLGEQCVSNFVEARDEDLLKAPLELILCDTNGGGCGLLQLRHTVDSEEMYRNYWYRSGVNQTMRDALADIAQRVEQFVNLTPSDLVVDIGSNDNTLLKAYKTEGLTKIGFEPAKTVLPYAKEGATQVINDYFTKERLERLKLNKKAKAITAIAMFYDLEDPNKFVADAKECLAEDGILIIQQAYLPLMLKDNIFDNICHEHLEYYSLLSMEALLQRHDLEIIDVEINDVNGGSFRTYITHKEGSLESPIEGAKERVNNMRLLEQKMELSSLQAYSGFAQRVESIKKQVVEFIQKEVAAGKKVYVYGASTKGNTLLQYFGLDSSLITAAAERNRDKWGKKTVATNIPIVSEEEARAGDPDYFLVLPWHFMEEFKQREQAFLQRGGKFIVPLPEFEIIEAAI